MRRILAASAVLLLAGSVAEARPFYLAVYKEVFPSPSAQTHKCNLCHAGDTKTNRNEYGRKLAAKLPGKNIRDADVIRRVLKEIGPHPETPKPEPSPSPK